MTYSIIARDPQTGSIGVAVQSHWFDVGRDVVWLRHGVGAVVTQATTDRTYGWRGLDLMAEGQAPESALHLLVEGDASSPQRQVAIIDTAGSAAAHTGAECVAYADHLSGDGWSVQGNLLATPSVIEAMAHGYETAEGPLARRLLAALEAAQAMGGDLRGVQSAALRIIPAATADPDDEGEDLRVADHEDPLGELSRLANLSRDYRSLRRALDSIAEGRSAAALEMLGDPEEVGARAELGFWKAIGLTRLGSTVQAAQLLDSVVALNPNLTETLQRLARTDPAAARLAELWKHR